MYSTYIEFDKRFIYFSKKILIQRILTPRALLISAEKAVQEKPR